MKDIKPNYYRRTIKGVEIDVNDIADAFDLGYQAQNAIKYLVRAGRKDETKLVDDLIKARHYIDRLINKHEEAERAALYEQIEGRDSAPRSFDRSEVSAIVADYIKDLGPLVQETNPETIADGVACGVACDHERGHIDATLLLRTPPCPHCWASTSCACCGQVHDACAPVEPKEISPAEMKDMLDEIRKPVVLAATPAPAVATAWPFWVFLRRAPRDYTIAGPYPTRDAARRALDPGRSDERVVMADDPYLVESDVVERLFT